MHFLSTQVTSSSNNGTFILSQRKAHGSDTLKHFTLSTVCPCNALSCQNFFSYGSSPLSQEVINIRIKLHKLGANHTLDFYVEEDLVYRLNLKAKTPHAFLIQ